MIAKSYQKLKDTENTIKYLKMTREYPVKTLDDEQVGAGMSVAGPL